MLEVLFRMGGVILALGVGLGWGWVARRLFARPFIQDVSAALAGWLLGCVMPVAFELAWFVLPSATGGIGAVSVGSSEMVVFGLPVALVLVVAAQGVRRRWSHPTAIPVVLGGLAALLAGLWIAATISSSVG
jgi:hypothetical protein